jgi:hypothetical protein
VGAGFMPGRFRGRRITMTLRIAPTSPVTAGHLGANPAPPASRPLRETTVGPVGAFAPVPLTPLPGATPPLDADGAAALALLTSQMVSQRGDNALRVQTGIPASVVDRLLQD